MPKKIENPRELIFQCAKRLLLEEGYSQLNMRTIAKSCGISVGTVYNYFEDKNVLDMVLMTAFWSDYEIKVVDIFKNDQLDFYQKLRQTQEEMTLFVSRFVELFSELFNARQRVYGQEEKDEKNRLIKNLSQLIENEILEIAPHLAQDSPNAAEIADWILISMMMISHMGDMTYDQLEKFVKKIVS